VKETNHDIYVCMGAFPSVLTDFRIEKSAGGGGGVVCGVGCGGVGGGLWFLGCVGRGKSVFFCFINSVL